MTDINALDQKIERIVKRTVKHYYTDWKNYDRPKYMGFKNSNDREDKEMILIARECGTYLVRTADLYKSDWATTIYEYYMTQETAHYYLINLDSLTIKKIDPETYGKAAKRAA